ncbi:MAG TPA: ABC transporter substrate-binding protein [Polyangiales bacterium]|nr:ABC transporter substrate-binding protein [Polyangiales bacterium]
MKAFDFAQAAWLLLLLVAAVYLGSAARPERANLAAAAPPLDSAPLRDAVGHTPANKHFQRIASSSAYADELLLALAEPERIVALSGQGQRSQREAFRYGTRTLISGPGDLERLLRLRVDLLLITHFGGQADLARAREGGIEVFDLGDMRGLATLEQNMLAVASLLGDRARGERLWRSWSRQLRAVARDVPQSERKAALYIAIYANKVYGGTIGTSYHDVLTAAGLRDLAADKFRDWPQYDPEQLLDLDPPLIVTEGGMAEQLCNHSWLRSLRACKTAAKPFAGVVEISRNLMGSAGLGMLDAALELRERVYPAD